MHKGGVFEPHTYHNQNIFYSMLLHLHHCQFLQFCLRKLCKTEEKKERGCHCKNFQCVCYSLSSPASDVVNNFSISVRSEHVPCSNIILMMLVSIVMSRQEIAPRACASRPPS